MYRASLHGRNGLGNGMCRTPIAFFIPPHQNELAKAAALLHLVLTHPASEQRTRDRAAALLEVLAAKHTKPRPPEDKDLWTVVAELTAALRLI